MKFCKMHGIGNDFIMVDGLTETIPADLKALAVKLCDRHFGVGGDGLILVLKSEIADIQMRIFNSDGSEAEMCGNGIRCFARLVYEKGYIKKGRFQVETLAGIMTPEIVTENGRVAGVKVDMGEPFLEREKVPMLGQTGQAVNEQLWAADREFRITALLMGVPHCVIFVDDVNAVDLAKYGPAIEKNPIFPRKTNVHFVEVISADELKMKVWERGAGITLACGTGACAALVSAVLNRKTGRKALVHLPGGTLQVEWAENNHVYMTGPAVTVFEGEMK